MTESIPSLCSFWPFYLDALPLYCQEYIPPPPPRLCNSHIPLLTEYQVDVIIYDAIFLAPVIYNMCTGVKRHTFFFAIMYSWYFLMWILYALLMSVHFCLLISLQLTSLELQYVSPKLLSCRDLELAVPGSYDANKPIVRIQKVAPALNVITSKQRPRKLSLYGSDGAEFMFLLKGHEDLRQDERVMQLFGLVNTLLANDPETFKRHLSILRYSVIPLSTNSGLIGWVPHCDTLHALIRDYREKRKILLNVEHRLMVRVRALRRFVTTCFSLCLWALRVVRLTLVFIPPTRTSHLPTDIELGPLGGD